MKKVLSVIMALVMSLTTLLALPAAVQAADNYDNAKINRNIEYIKGYIKSNGSINGNGEYTLQHSGLDQSIRYYGLFIVTKDNKLLLDYKRCNAYDVDEIYNATTLEIEDASKDTLKACVDFWVISKTTADLSGYAYIDRNFNHNTQQPVFYIDKNQTSYPDTKAVEMCGENFSYAFKEWSFMMDDIFAMDLSVLGFHSYCEKHVYGYDADSCIMCGYIKPNNSAPSTSTSTDTTSTTASKPKATALSKVTAGKKQFKAVWKKAAGVAGYQLQYSTDKKFKKGNKTVTVKGASKTTSTVKKLKSKKTYYVRVRSYKTVNGKKVYSSWSKVKSVKVK